MVYVHRITDDAKDELIAIIDQQFLLNFFHEYCFLRSIHFETQINPKDDGTYLIYSGHDRRIYEIIEIKNGQRNILYSLLIC